MNATSSRAHTIFTIILTQTRTNTETMKVPPNAHGARPVHLITTMIKWIRTSRLSIKNCLSLSLHPPFRHRAMWHTTRQSGPDSGLWLELFFRRHSLRNHPHADAHQHRDHQGEKSPKPETRNLEPETRNMTPETRNVKPEISNPKPEIRNPQTRRL